MRTINVWRQIIAVVRYLAYPKTPAESGEAHCGSDCVECAIAEIEALVSASGGVGPFAVLDERLILVDSCAKVPAAGWGFATKDTVPTMEAHGRTWYKGPPPHVGWWNASLAPGNAVAPVTWRWWDGKRWSKLRFSDLDTPGDNEDGTPARIWWSNYYPEDAVVPRMTPEQWKERACASA